MSHKSVYVRDLKDDYNGRNVVLHCDCCGQDWSAAAGDYWAARPETTLRCSECAEPMMLAVKRTVYDEV
jgi:hypothetical protein